MNAKEYPKEWKIGDEPFYAINNTCNNNIYTMYSELARMQKNCFGDRLAEYRYYDMGQIIKNALSTALLLIGHV